MKYWTRKQGSQRASATRQVTFEPNFGGQGGFSYMALFDGTTYHCIQPETVAEAREIQSQGAILALNVKEPKNG